MLAVAAFVGAMHAPLQAQAAQPDPATLDPNAPMDAMPGLGVDWPDMNAPDPKPDPEPVSPTKPPTTTEAADAIGSIEDSAAARRYVVRVEGVGAEDSAVLLAAFKSKSALEEGAGKPANAAQIDRRARADAGEDFQGVD